MKRNEVPDSLKWRLEDIFPSIQSWEQALAAFHKDTVGVLRFKGKLSVKESALACFQFMDEISARLERLFCYAMFKKDENTVDTKAQELKSQIETIWVQFSTDASFVTPELSNLDTAVLESWAADPAFKAYDYQLKSLIRKKNHILSEVEERLLARAGKMTGAFDDIFSAINNSDLPLPVITIEGKKQKMTHGLYSLWLQNKDPDVRKRAFIGMYKAIESMIETTAQTFAASINKDNFLAQVRNYSSAQEKALVSKDIPTRVYSTLLEETEKHLSPLHDYIALRKKVLKLPELHMYDLAVPMFENAEIALPYSEAYDLMAEGLSAMGAEYNGLLKKAKEQRWIDVEETENKRSGAYSCGVYGVHPYILLNYKPTTNNLFTIAHEMGHALHSYYSAKNQPYAKNDYEIFVAEVASTVNEVLLLKYLIGKEKNSTVKKYLLSYYIDMFRTTLFRQTMFAEFESITHSAEQKGTPLTVDYLNKQYLKLNKKYYGDAVKHDRQIRLEWARIPHFYRAFYVYQYATGLVSAVNIANSILNEEPQAFSRYKDFLSAGGHKSPYEILKDAEVDLLQEEPYKIAFGEFEAAVRELERLCE